MAMNEIYYNDDDHDDEMTMIMIRITKYKDKITVRLNLSPIHIL